MPPSDVALSCQSVLSATVVNSRAPASGGALIERRRALRRILKAMNDVSVAARLQQYLSENGFTTGGYIEPTVELSAGPFWWR